MDELVIYGASDDLIEIESTVFGAEEFNVNLDYAEESILIAISDGTVLRANCDEDGIWRFLPILAGSASVDIQHGWDDKFHSDLVTMTGDNLRWVVLGSALAK